jgi:hypothetical protein
MQTEIYLLSYKKPLYIGEKAVLIYPDVLLRAACVLYALSLAFILTL